MDPINIAISGLGAAALVGVAIFMANARRQRSKPKAAHAPATKVVDMDKPTTETMQDVIDDLEERECYVYTDATRRASIRIVPGAALKAVRKEYGSLGRLWNMDGKPLYALNLDTNGHYTPCEKFMREDMLNSPRRAYIATQQQAVTIYYQPKDTRNILQKYGAILLFVAVVLFFMFVSVTS